jgi:hypothetical protein
MNKKNQGSDPYHQKNIEPKKSKDEKKPRGKDGSAVSLPIVERGRSIEGGCGSACACR